MCTVGTYLGTRSECMEQIQGNVAGLPYFMDISYNIDNVRICFSVRQSRKG